MTSNLQHVFLALCVFLAYLEEMWSISEEEFSEFTSGDESELSSESSDERTGSTTAAFVPYDKNLEPIAAENEAAEYAEEVGQEEEEEQSFKSVS